MKLNKIFKLSLILLFSSSCIDEDRLKDEDGYHVDTYFAKGTFKNESFLESDYIFNYKDGLTLTDDFLNIYNEDNPYYNSKDVDTFDLDIHFELKHPSFYKLNLKVTDLSVITNKTISFNNPLLSSQEPISDYEIQKNESYIFIERIIFSDETYAFPRVMGNAFIVCKNNVGIDTLIIETFELPFDQKQ
ncbi:MAG: hypothetical protein ACPGSD_08070 [Flavobacteriales bacterium]